LGLVIRRVRSTLPSRQDRSSERARVRSTQPQITRQIQGHSGNVAGTHSAGEPIIRQPVPSQRANPSAVETRHSAFLVFDQSCVLVHTVWVRAGNAAIHKARCPAWQHDHVIHLVHGPKCACAVHKDRTPDALGTPLAVPHCVTALSSPGSHEHIIVPHPIADSAITNNAQAGKLAQFRVGCQHLARKKPGRKRTSFPGHRAPGGKAGPCPPPAGGVHSSAANRCAPWI